MPVPSWPMFLPEGGSGTLIWSPRQVWRSEPQTPACVMRRIMPFGSGSGTSYSSMTNGSLYSLTTTMRPVVMRAPLRGAV